MNSTLSLNDGIVEDPYYHFVGITVVRISSSFSIAGSAFIIQDVLRNPRKRTESVYHRIMIGFSIMDILVSFFSFFLHSWPLPKGYNPMAMGSVTTCDLTAFFSTIGLFSTPLYNCSLATYYLIQLKYNWVRSRIKSAEKWLHILPLSVGLIIAITGFATQIYGPFMSFCWVTSAYPVDCNEPDSSVECIRSGNNIFQVFWAFIVLCQVFTFLFVCIAMFKVYRTVLTIEMQSRRFSFVRFQEERNNNKRSQRIMIQGILYATAMVFTYVPCILLYLLGHVIDKGLGFIPMIYNIFTPFQGFLNFLVYLMPVYVKIHKKRLEKKRATLREEREDIKINLFRSSKQLTKEKTCTPQSNHRMKVEDEKEKSDTSQNNIDDAKALGNLKLHENSDCGNNISKESIFYSTIENGDESKEETVRNNEGFFGTTKEDEELKIGKSLNFFSVVESAMQDDGSSDDDSDDIYW